MRIEELEDEVGTLVMGAAPRLERLTPALGKPSVNVVPIAALEGRAVAEIGDDEKRTIAHEFFLSGNLSAIARERRIAYNDLLDMARMPWFGEEVRNLERESNAQLKVRLTKMLGQTLDELENRLDRGDLVWRDHGLRVIPVPARDLASIASTVFDKRRAIEDAESGFGTSEGKRLMALAEALRAKQAQTEVYDAEVIAAEESSHRTA